MILPPADQGRRRAERCARGSSAPTHPNLQALDCPSEPAARAAGRVRGLAPAALTERQTRKIGCVAALRPGVNEVIQDRLVQDYEEGRHREYVTHCRASPSVRQVPRTWAVRSARHPALRTGWSIRSCRSRLALAGWTGTACEDAGRYRYFFNGLLWPLARRPARPGPRSRLRTAHAPPRINTHRNSPFTTGHPMS